MNDITEILKAVNRGEANAAEQLMPLVYDELRKLAADYLDNEKAGQTLQPTALVHEAFIRLVGHDGGAKCQGRDHFFAAAALAMRRILVDIARRKKRDKRGGDWQRVGLADQPDPRADKTDRVLALDEVLSRLAAADAPAAELVQLHTFGGLSIEDAGKYLGLSRTVAYQEWAFARAWLRHELDDSDEKKSGRIPENGA